MTLDTGPCPRCKGDTISGRSSGPTAWDIRVDAAPLDPLAELTSTVAGCRTWTLHTVAGELYLRSPRKIVSSPAGTRDRQTVHADHVCPTRRGTPTP